jgi:hypothetical protein
MAAGYWFNFITEKLFVEFSSIIQVQKYAGKRFTWP